MKFSSPGRLPAEREPSENMTLSLAAVDQFRTPQSAFRNPQAMLARRLRQETAEFNVDCAALTDAKLDLRFQPAE